MYKAGQVCEITETNQQLLTRWIDREFIYPTLFTKGSGNRHLFDDLCICQILLFKKLNLAGFNRKASSRIAFSDEIKIFFKTELSKKNKDYRIFDELMSQIIPLKIFN